MWLGESERKVREIFQIAREKSKEGFLPFVFIDEAESILGTRRSFRSHNISNTVVPMFCAEMDGIESLQDVVIILATNRPDLIDPAILRPGRIDRKIKVTRPDKEASRAIFAFISHQIYRFIQKSLMPTTAIQKQQLLTSLIRSAMNCSIETKVTSFRVALRSGRRDIMYRGDLCSGAIVDSIVQRAKESAIKRAIEGTEGRNWNSG